MGRLFGTDGARGVANTELTGELAGKCDLDHLNRLLLSVVA